MTSGGYHKGFCAVLHGPSRISLSIDNESDGQYLDCLQNALSDEMKREKNQMKGRIKSGWLGVDLEGSKETK